MNRLIRFGISIDRVVIQDILDSFSVVSLIFDTNGWRDFVGCKEVSFNPKESLGVTNHADYQVLSKTNDDLIFNQNGGNNHVN